MWPKFPAFGAEPKGFDDLFKITFTLSPQKLMNKQIWMVQDQNEERTSTTLLLMQQAAAMAPRVGQSMFTQVSNMGVFELIAFAGGLWYFISHMVLGPFVRKYLSNKLFQAELNHDLAVHNKINDVQVDDIRVNVNEQ